MRNSSCHHLLPLLVLVSLALLLGFAAAGNEANSLTEKAAATSTATHVRVKRGIFWDFFQKMVITKNLIVDVSVSSYP